MLQRAQELRRWFLQLGYSAQAREEDASLMGGPCWGPGAPLPIPVMPSPSREHLRIAAYYRPDASARGLEIESA